MRNPWFIELRRDGRTVSRFFTSKREAVDGVEFALAVEEFKLAELFRRSDRKSIAKYVIVDGTLYPIRAKAKLDKP